ncbi:hypothetical protein [Mahella australiensis]|uniref:Lipoprotein n=1 Tax=Mahella australiensis (strain DSM 15567 / CIP 107919 / 50-1 BON) TaxID=697281 RepID=F3ZZB1_MAHA5|nr:hypothetical protein [Mahella australiensis]AEE95721.1 hypothetical protein Mahau_0513 [Mahella australiensis 50-1 BON]
MKLKFVFMYMLIVSFTVLFGCISTYQSSNANREVYSKDVSNYIATVTTTMDKSRIYNDIDELIKYSDAIFDGSIQEVSYFDKGNYTYSKLKISITNSYYGDLKIGDIVTVVEPGGVTTLANYKKIVGDKKFNNIAEQDADEQYVKISYNGTELSKDNDNVLIFTCKDKNNYWDLPNDYYFIVGYKDGKFDIDTNSVKRNGKDPSLEPLSMAKENYKNIIKDKISKKIR